MKTYLSILLFALTVFVGTAREINTRADSVRITVSDGTELHVTVGVMVSRACTSMADPAWARSG